MEIIKEEKKDIILLKIDGKFDAVSAPEAEKVIDKVIRDGVKKIVISMEKVRYISSAGLRTLLIAAKDIKAEKGKIVICSMPETVNKVFEISGFSTIFETCDTEAEAIKRF
jgi:anti-anti-sigma factor